MTLKADLLSPESSAWGVSLGAPFNVEEASWSTASAYVTGSFDANTPKSFTAQVSGSTTHLVSEAGVSYNPATLSGVLGTGTFDMSWGSEGSNISSGTVSAALTSFDFYVTPDSYYKVTYNTVSAVPEPSGTLGLAGLIAGSAFLRRRKAA